MSQEDNNFLRQLDQASDEQERTITMRADTRLNGGIRQLVTSRRLRIEANGKAHKSRVFYVAKDGREVEISDCVKSVKLSVVCGKPVIAELTCFAEADFNLDGDYLLSNSETPRTIDPPPEESDLV